LIKNRHFEFTQFYKFRFYFVKEMKNFIIYFAILVFFCGCARLRFSKETIFTQSAPTPIGPYSQAVAFGNLVFVSGQIGINPVDGSIPPDVEQQCRQTIENIRNILSASGSELDNVLKVTIYLTDMNDFAKINQIYSEYFKEDFPARETVEVTRLPKNAKIEISVVAYKKR